MRWIWTLPVLLGVLVGCSAAPVIDVVATEDPPAGLEPAPSSSDTEDAPSSDAEDVADEASPPAEITTGGTSADGPIPRLSATSLFGVYYGDWTEALIDEVTGATGKPRYDLVIAHPNTNLTRDYVATLQAGGVQVFCYLSIGEDDTLHTSAASGGIVGPGGWASWYYDANHDGQPDQNGIWDSYYANVADPAWREALRTYRNEGPQGWYGYDYLLQTLGCDGLFLDTIDTVTPAAWGGAYSAELPAMIDLIAEIRAHLPTGRSLLINRGLFYFDPYEASTNPDGLQEITPTMRDQVRQLVHGVHYENFMEESPEDRADWGTRVTAEAGKPDGFTVLSLDYVADPNAATGEVPTICAATRGAYGWLPHVSTVDLQSLSHAVRDQCAPQATDPIVAAAGDIATSWSDMDEATAQLLDAFFATNAPGRVLTLGDNAYDSGALSEYLANYDPTWGRHKARTAPSVGNHEYGTPGAQGYFDYFGAAAGDPAKGYYSFDLGSWHVIALNSNCTEVGGCGVGSAQWQWLVADLAQSTAPCTLSYWHRPRFSSGLEHGSSTRMQAAWQALYDAGAEVILVGHEHHYERFAPQTATGVLDVAQGLRQFVVGTGGADLYPLGPPIANSEVANDTTYGVLKLNLRAASYEWEFLPIAGQTFTDSGSAACH